jgi:polyhydroxyalkanoate synthase
MKKQDTLKMPLNDNDKQAAAQKQIDSLPNPLALSQALTSAYERSQPLFQKIAERLSQSMSFKAAEPINPDPMNIGGAFTDLVTGMATNPYKFLALQIDHSQKLTSLMQNCQKKFFGESVDDVIAPEKGDRRFRSPEWSESVFFDFIKQYYLLACDFVEQSIEKTEGLSDQKKEKLSFVSKLFMDALSPSNFIMTNPEVLKETIETGGENLVKGLENLNKDLERGQGELKISTTNYDAFKLGKNIATTPGAVVFENDLIQLIQYKPSTAKSYKRPLLVIPPWINKYYILDLKPESSYIKWAVDQGHTVFCISWVNPDQKLADKSFADYMKEGVLASLDEIEHITGEYDVNAVGYCLGGTLLATTMAYLKAKKQSTRIASATFLTTLLDFEKAGDMKLFMDESQIEAMEKSMQRKGVLEARELQKTFSLLRANDLIWSFVVNNYLMGKEPFPFDLLYWNDDSTNMPAAMHSYYLKNMYRDNRLVTPGALEMDGVKIDLTTIDTPCYFLSTRDDHIAPWEATYRGVQLMSGPKTFTLAASGHIAGIINPPTNNKYCYWTEDGTPENPKDWMENAVETAGSWWPHWNNWISKFAGEQMSARKLKKTIEPAPGRYVQKSA